MASGERSCVAYVLKGWPRLSELFIASEIARLEARGVPLRLYVLKPADEELRHPVVERIRAEARYLPAAGSISAVSARRWLADNLGAFRGGLAGSARRHPAGLARAAAAALAQSHRARKGRFAWRKIYLKELLQAAALADEVDRAGDVGHLHAHFAHGTTTVTWLASLITGLPFSFTGHAKDIYNPALNPAGLLARKLRAARFAATCTDANRRHLETIAPDAAVRLVYHGLNADFARLLHAPDAPPPQPAAPPQVLAVGRLVAKKGFDTFVEAIALLRGRGVELRVVIAGESGPHEAAVRALIAERGLSGDVELRGPLTQAELLAEHRRSTVFALACRVDDDGDRDGIPNVLVEAMAAGLAVVSTAVSGIPELIRSGENGLLVAPDDPPALADAILAVLKDPTLAAQLGAAAAADVAARFDGDALAEQMAALFSEAAP
ncbi:MAG: glycosyltransferase family 4 protein [Acidimicrobiales bacterium]